MPFLVQILESAGIGGILVDGAELRQELREWFDWYNRERSHQSLDYQTPDKVYFQSNTDFSKVA